MEVEEKGQIVLMFEDESLMDKVGELICEALEDLIGDEVNDFIWIGNEKTLNEIKLVFDERLLEQTQ